MLDATAGRKSRNKQGPPAPYVEKGSKKGKAVEEEKPLSRRQNKKAKVLAANGGVKPSVAKAKGKKRAREVASDDEAYGQDSDDDEGLAAARQ